jgi:hypothetical protein
MEGFDKLSHRHRHPAPQSIPQHSLQRNRGIRMRCWGAFVWIAPEVKGPKRNIVPRGLLPMNRSFVVAAFNCKYWMATLARESRIRCTLRCERGATDHRTLNRGCEHIFYILFLDRVLRVRTTRGFFGQSQRPLCLYQLARRYQENL